MTGESALSRLMVDGYTDPPRQRTDPRYSKVDPELVRAQFRDPEFRQGLRELAEKYGRPIPNMPTPIERLEPDGVVEAPERPMASADPEAARVLLEERGAELHEVVEKLGTPVRYDR